MRGNGRPLWPQEEGCIAVHLGQEWVRGACAIHQLPVARQDGPRVRLSLELDAVADNDMVGIGISPPEGDRVAVYRLAQGQRLAQVAGVDGREERTEVIGFLELRF